MIYSDNLKLAYKNLKHTYLQTISITVFICNLVCICILSCIHIKNKKAEIISQSAIIYNSIVSNDIVSRSDIKVYTDYGYSIYIVKKDFSSCIALGLSDGDADLSTFLCSKEHYYSTDNIIKVKMNRHNYYIYPMDWHSSYVIVTYPASKMFHSIMLYIMIILGMTIVIICTLYIMSISTIRNTLDPVAISQQKQDEFISHASHELRTPLTIITNSVIAMKEAHDYNNATFEEQYNLALSECHRSSNLITTMLSLARCDTKKLSKTEVVHPDDLIILCYERYQTIIRQKGLILNIDLPEDVISVSLYKDIVIQILSIFLDNAISHANRNEIQIGYEIINHEIAFFVKNTGVFLSSAVADYANHFGIGLNIANDLLKNHGGRTNMETDSSGIKYSFMFKL